MQLDLSLLERELFVLPSHESSSRLAIEDAVLEPRLLAVALRLRDVSIARRERHRTTCWSTRTLRESPVNWTCASRRTVCRHSVRHSWQTVVESRNVLDRRLDCRDRKESWSLDERDWRSLFDDDREAFLTVFGPVPDEVSPVAVLRVSRGRDTLRSTQTFDVGRRRWQKRSVFHCCRRPRANGGWGRPPLDVRRLRSSGVRLSSVAFDRTSRTWKELLALSKVSQWMFALHSKDVRRLEIEFGSFRWSFALLDGSFRCCTWHDLNNLCEDESNDWSLDEHKAIVKMPEENQSKPQRCWSMKEYSVISSTGERASVSVSNREDRNRTEQMSAGNTTENLAWRREWEFISHLHDDTECQENTINTARRPMMIRITISPLVSPKFSRPRLWQNGHRPRIRWLDRAGMFPSVARTLPMIEQSVPRWNRLKIPEERCAEDWVRQQELPGVRPVGELFSEESSGVRKPPGNLS